MKKLKKFIEDLRNGIEIEVEIDGVKLLVFLFLLVYLLYLLHRS